MNKPLVLHPFLIAIYPILFLYGANIDQDPTLWQVSVLLIAIAGGVSFIMFSLINFIIKDNLKSGLITSIFFLLFYSFGKFNRLDPLKDLTAGFSFQIGTISIDSQKFLLLTWTAIILIGAYLTLKTNKSLNFITNCLNIFFGLLVFISLITILTNISYALSPSLSYSIDSMKEEPMTLETSDELPDIYYIILDMYPSSNTLRDIFGFDNSDFEKHLRQKGFFVTNVSRSNYGPKTMECLACYLNMDYLGNISSVEEALSKHKTIPFEVIQNNKVARFLKSKGYIIVNIGSGWGPTAINHHADLNLYNNGFGTPDQSEFLNMYIRATMLGPFYDAHLDLDQSRVLFAFSKLEDLPNIRHPKFVLAHFMSPHIPYVFGKNGEKVPTNIAYDSSPNSRQLFLNQTIFINHKLEHLIDSLIAESKVAPIIIIQSDHGPRFTYGNSASDNCYPNQTLLEERTTIFNAYYIPNNKNIHLYDSITPVNSFRLIFNSVFGTNYSLLSDRSYYSCDEPEEIIDVTDKLRNQ